MTIGNAPVKYIAAVLTGHLELLDEVMREMAVHFGPVDYVGQWFDFTQTVYYAAEMGDNLKRVFVAFNQLRPPEDLPKAKIWAEEVEEKFRQKGLRRINIDPGYIDHCKVVLASGKFGGHKVAVTKGCFADFLMLYNKGNWEPLPWCFPDFASGIYNDTLTQIRRIFKQNRLHIPK